MAELVLGPMHRWASTDEATVWVEADSPCEVEVRAGDAAASERTFEVEGHHYAIVRVSGLPENSATPYEVTLDATRVWPEPDSEFPPSALRTHAARGPARVVFGSCRTAYPHEPPYTLTPDEDDCGREVDALRAVAYRMADSDPDEWPHTVLLLGDQVYADEVSPDTLDFMRSRRDTSVPPGETISDFEEYTRLYQEAWSDPPIRWLLSTVPSAMIFDDHDVIDDWNTSQDWVDEMRATDWWDRRIVGAFMAYVLYQHWGNLAPDTLEDDPVYQRVREAGDGGDILAEAAFTWDREVSGVRWSYCRDIGASRIVMIDSRAGRVLTPGERSMVDSGEWRWIVEHATGGFDHLLIGTSLPLIMAPGLHYLEAWNEAVCDGAWGRLAARVGEKIRQGADLEHWPAFRDSFEAVCALLREVGAGGQRPRAGQHRRPVGRRPPRLPGRGRLPGRQRRQLARVAGDVLAVPQSAQRQGAARRHVQLQPRGHGGRPRAGPPGRGAAAAGALAFPGRRPAVRQPGRHARARRPAHAGAARARHAVRRRPRAPTARDRRRASLTRALARLTTSSQSLKTCDGAACMMMRANRQEWRRTS